MEQSYKTRIRVNFSVSVKGVVTPEVTFEGIDLTKEECIKEAKELLELAQIVAKEKSLAVV